MLSVDPSVASPYALSARMVSVKDSMPAGAQCPGVAVEVTTINYTSAFKIEKEVIYQQATLKKYIQFTLVFSIFITLFSLRIFKIYLAFLFMVGRKPKVAQSVPYILIHCKDTRLVLSERTYMQPSSLNIHEEFVSQKILVIGKQPLFILAVNLNFEQ